MSTIVIEVLQNVNFMTNTPVIADQAEQQLVYEGYSNVSGCFASRLKKEPFTNALWSSSSNPSSNSWTPSRPARPS